MSQQQLGHGTSAGQQQQRATQERAPISEVGTREDVGALFLLQQPSSVPVQQQRAPVSQVGIDDVYDNEVSQLTSSITLEDPFFESHKSRTIDPALQTPIARSDNNNTFTTTNINVIGSHPSSQSGSRPPSHTHSRSSSQIGSRPPSQNHLHHSSAQMLSSTHHSSVQMLSSTPHGVGTMSTNDDVSFDDDFAEDAQMNRLFDEEFLGGTIIGKTQQCSTPTFDNVAPYFEGVHPDFIMQRLKLIKPEILNHLKLKPFYKSYCSWEKLTDQKNKTLSFFRKLPEQLQGTVFNFLNLFHYFL